MAFLNNLRQIKVIIYRLKRNFGLPLDFINRGAITHNVTTGAITTPADTTISVKRAIILPTRLIRDFAYDLSYIAANKNFTYGGFFDISSRVIIIDAKDLPSGFEPSQNDHVVFEGKKHEIKEIHEAEQNTAFLMVTKELKAA